MLATLVVVFVLASFVGVEIISKVPQTLHTPLMSGSNAISGITIVGALVVAGMVDAPAARWMGFVALVLATINVVGGFLVTDRMLQMFRRDPRPSAADTAMVPPADRHGGRP
ncbi:MAG TPA: NAD(P) transhydrogenase subunit alpha [Longimicrobium sp.]